MKDVVFLIKCMYMGGAERILSMLANYSADSGCNTTVILTHQSLKNANLSRTNGNIKIISLDDEIAKEKKHIFFPKIKMYEARIEGKLGRIFGRKLSDSSSVKKYHSRNYDKISWLKRYFKSKPNSCAVAFLYDSIFLTLLSAAKQSRIIISERGDPRQSVSSRTDMAFMRSMFKKANAIVCQSPDAAAWYKTNIGLESAVIFNPIKADLPTPYHGERKKKIVDFCRITSQKNLFLLLKSFELLAKQYPQYELYIYGDAAENEKKYAEEFLKAIKESPFSSNIHVYPARNDIHKEILDHSMFVSSSDFEGMSNSMLEAMAIGLPTICTDCPAGGARAVIKDHENGILVPVGDEKALYTAMKEIIEDPGLADKLSLNSRSIRERQSCDKILKKWMDIINA